jgi:hypothetical protein
MPSTKTGLSESQWRHHRLLATDYGSALYVGLLLTLGCAQATVRYLRLAVGYADPHPDVRTTWEPVAQAVLSGTPLYLGDAIDNKPPLFEYLNVAVALSDAYLANFLLLVGVANACVGVLLWRLAVRDGRPLVGVYAGLVYVVAAPLALGDAVNVRTFSLVFVLAAVLARRASVSGGLVGGAVLISQYALLALPGSCYCRLRSERTGDAIRWVVRSGLVFAGVLTAGFVSVSLIWGPTAFVASIRWSVLSAERYVIEWGPSLWTRSGVWLSMHVATATRLVVVLVLASVGSLSVGRRLRRGTALTGDMRTLCFAALFCVPLVVRSFPTYWLYPLPWFSMLAVDGLVTIHDRL